MLHQAKGSPGHTTAVLPHFPVYSPVQQPSGAETSDTTAYNCYLSSCTSGRAVGSHFLPIYPRNPQVSHQPSKGLFGL